MGQQIFINGQSLLHTTLFFEDNSKSFSAQEFIRDDTFFVVVYLGLGLRLHLLHILGGACLQEIGEYDALRGSLEGDLLKGVNLVEYVVRGIFGHVDGFAKHGVDLRAVAHGEHGGTALFGCIEAVGMVG